MIRLTCIAGSTATGKTRLAVDVAHRLGSEIVSVDSRQVYRGLDIGSGKDVEEYSRPTPPVPVHLIDVADPATSYSVFHYQRDCYRLFAEASVRQPFLNGTPLVMAGGTGLFLEAVLKGFSIPDVAANPALRAELMERDREELVERLRKESPTLAARTDLSNKKRVVRALEIAEHSRRGPVRFSEPPPVKMSYAVFAVAVEREELRRRIDARLEERIASGLIEEVRRLLEEGLTPRRLMQLGLEYREVTSYITGRTPFDRMVTDLRHGIYRFAKRQQTWFRGMERRGIPVTWIAPEDIETVLKRLTE